MQLIQKHIGKTNLWQLQAISSPKASISVAPSVDCRMFDYGYNQFEDILDQGTKNRNMS